MSAVSALPTARDEAWRYSDLGSVEKLWPLPDARVVEVAAGERWSEVAVLEARAATSDVRQVELHLGDGAHGDVRVLSVGDGFARFELTVTLGEGATFDFGAAQIGGADATLEIVTNARHDVPNGVSRQVVRSVLAGRATGTFLGKIDVARDAQKTDAEQSVKAMLLNRGATANAVPQLEIFADDVKCAHGATVGELDSQALFYMGARGLPPATARRLMLQAFIADAFVGMADDEARARLEERALAALDELA